MAQEAKARPSNAEGAIKALLLTSGAEACASAKHPLVLIGFATSIWFLLQGLVQGAVVWHMLSVSLGGYMLPLIASAFLLGSWTASTEIRYATEEYLDSLTHGRLIRTLALLGGAAGPLAYALVLVAVAHIAGLALAPAGRVLWGEIAAVFLAVAIAWVGGSVLGRAQRVRAAPVLLLIVYGALQLLGSPDVELGAPEVAQENDLGRLLLWMPSSAFDSPFDALMRPTWPRVWFLSSVVAMLVVVLVARSARRLKLPVLASGIVATVLVISGAHEVLSFVPEQPWVIADMSRPRVDWELVTSQQVCKSSGDVLYCAYPGFEPWIERWGAVVARVSTIQAPQLSEIAQRPQLSNFPGYYPSPHSATVFFAWDRPGTGRPIEAFAMASRIGHTMVGLPAGPYDACDAEGQGRSVFPLWIAAVSTDGGDALLAELDQARGLTRDIEGVPIGGALLDARSFSIARQLVDMDDASVRSVFAEHWTELLDPQLAVGSVAEWFGFSALPHVGNTPNEDSIQTFGRLDPCD